MIHCQMKYKILFILMLTGGLFLSSCRKSDPEEPKAGPGQEEEEKEEEVPLDFLRIRVTTNKGFDRTVELHSLPEKMQVSNTDHSWKYYWETVKGQEELKPYFLFTGSYSEMGKGDVYVSFEIVGFSPENTTCRTVHQIGFSGDYEYMYSRINPHPEWREVFSSCRSFLETHCEGKDLEGMLNSFYFSRNQGSPSEPLLYDPSMAGTLVIRSQDSRQKESFVFITANTR